MPRIFSKLAVLVHNLFIPDMKCRYEAEFVFSFSKEGGSTLVRTNYHSSRRAAFNAAKAEYEAMQAKYPEGELFLRVKVKKDKYWYYDDFNGKLSKPILRK